MSGPVDRRSILKGALWCASGAAAGPVLSACGAPEPEPEPEPEPLDVEELSEGVVLMAGAGGNILSLSTPDGVVLVDSGAPPHAASVVAAVRGLPSARPVRVVFNTHHHLDQTGGNETFADRGAQIIAHARAKLRMSAKTWDFEAQAYVGPRPPKSRPTQVFHTTGSLVVGGEWIDYGYLVQAHTDGDIYVLFREANVLAAGDVVSPVKDPSFDWFAGGWLGGRVDALDKLLALSNDATKIIPSCGPVLTRADLQAERDMMATLFDRAHTLIRRGRSGEDMVAEGALDGLGRTFDDPVTLMNDVYRGLWGHQSSLAQDII